MTEQQTRPREVTDEMLERMGLTRERFEEMQAERRRREEAAPKVGDLAPDFQLPTLGDGEKQVRLSDFRGERPVALLFGSYT